MQMSFEKYVQGTLAPSLKGLEKPSVILLTCMDFRYAHRISDVMDRWGLRQKYDMFVLAGAAAGANKVACWKDAFITHVRTAIEIHHPINRIVILEHRDCGAYGHFFGLDWKSVTPQHEQDKHEEQVQLFINAMKSEFALDIPDLQIDALLLTRDEDDLLHIETTPPSL